MDSILSFLYHRGTVKKSQTDTRDNFCKQTTQLKKEIKSDTARIANAESKVGHSDIMCSQSFVYSIL